MTAADFRPILVRPIAILEPALSRIMHHGLTRLRRPAGALAVCRPGDMLWVREAFHLAAKFDHLSPTAAERENAQPHFAADLPAGYADRYLGRRRFAREMPKVWHRQHLSLIAVTLEPLQSITEEEAIAEGHASRAAWADCWDRSLSLSGWAGNWDENPQVIVLDFGLVRGPVPGQCS